MRLLLYVIRKHRHYAKHFRQCRCRHRGEQRPGPWAAAGGTLTVLRRRAASWKSTHIKWPAAHNPSNTPSLNASRDCQLSSYAASNTSMSWSFEAFFSFLFVFQKKKSTWPQNGKHFKPLRLAEVFWIILCGVCKVFLWTQACNLKWHEIRGNQVHPHKSDMGPRPDLIHLPCAVSSRANVASLT